MLTCIECHCEKEEGVKCLQYDDNKIISGHRDSIIKVCMCTECVCYCVDIYTIIYRNSCAHNVSLCEWKCVLCLTVRLLKVMGTR